MQPGEPVGGVACTAPGSPGWPVSVGVVDWQGRLSLACRLHPAVAPDPSLAGTLLARWRERATTPPV
jgi:hypothetical protein